MDLFKILSHLLLYVLNRFRDCGTNTQPFYICACVSMYWHTTTSIYFLYLNNQMFNFCSLTLTLSHFPDSILCHPFVLTEELTSFPVKEQHQPTPTTKRKHINPLCSSCFWLFHWIIKNLLENLFLRTFYRLWFCSFFLYFVLIRLPLCFCW